MTAITELGVYKGYYEQLCANIPKNMKVPPMKLILVADKLKIKYDRQNIDWVELCAKVNIALLSLLD